MCYKQINGYAFWWSKGEEMRNAWWLGCLALLVAAAILVAQTSADQPLTVQIGSIFSALIQPGDPGAAVLVKKEGKILFEAGYGVRDSRSGAKIDPQTNFRLASVTKQFTAMAVMLLVHDGKLHYDDHLNSIFPDFPPYGRDITIRNLLNHTSGLPDYEDLMTVQAKNGGLSWSIERQIQDDQVLALLEAQSAGKFAPGTRWEYSNSGYVLLGVIVAKVSGMPYRDFLRRRIFVPLRMTNTLVFQKGINTVPRRAFGHSRETGRLVETDQSPTSATLGDGGVYSNLVDMGKWDEGLAKHTLLSEAEMQPALIPMKLADGSQPQWPREPASGNSGKPLSYGFGWFLDPYQGHTRNYHDGGTQGFRTTIQRFVDDRFTIVVLSNRTDLDPDKLALQIADLLLSSTAR
jgi:CubicO group peptidase (beta-lactamase class C family)